MEVPKQWKITFYTDMTVTRREHKEVQKQGPLGGYGTSENY
jgi:hypothetical protein